MYWKKLQTIDQSWKIVKNEIKIDEDGDDEVVAHQPQMDFDNLVVTTTKKFN
jgi:hypothetical protein